MTDVYGFVLTYKPDEGTLRYIPQRCTRVLVYSDDGKTFTDEPVGEHAKYESDLDWSYFNRLSVAGKYKLDIAVRAMFPRYAGAVKQ